MSESVPDLPLIPSSWYAQIFKGVAPDDYKEFETQDPPPTLERLIFMGETIFELGAKQWLHEHFRKHNNNSLKTKLAHIVPKKAGSWGKLYKLPSRLSVSATEQPIKLTAGDLFLAYLGAVYCSHGNSGQVSNAAIEWIKEILGYEAEEGSAESDQESSAQYVLLQTPVKCLSIDHSTLPMPLPAPGSPSPVASNTANAVSTLNELAMKKGKALNWKDESTGQDHMKTWIVRVVVDDKEYKGAGHNKKQARIAAAEEALKSIA